MKNIIVAQLAVLIVTVSTAWAQNVDLSTIPPRDSVQLTIYNSEDITLVRETRTLTFKRGVNPLQFSWANTLIDPTSVELTFKTKSDQLELIDTTFPHAKPQMLYWNVASELDGDATVEITYFTSGITWSADYVCVSDPQEEQLSFEGFVRITNNSGEDYSDAQVRMVVGTINLVEKVAELARRGLVSQDALRRFGGGRGGRKMSDLDGDARAAGRMVLSEMFAQAAPESEEQNKEIIKEGLSEYFIYTVPGTETVKNGWSKRMRLFQGTAVPFRIQYRYRPYEYGDRLVRMFLLKNDEASELGSTPLPDGVVRLYRDNTRDGLSFLVQQAIKYVPIGQDIELNLGTDPEVIHERIRKASRRDNFWFRRNGSNEYFSPTRGQRITPRHTVAGWDDHQDWVERIRNYRNKPIEVEIRRGFSGHVVFVSDLEPVLHDFRTPQFTATLTAGETSDLSYELTIHQGINKKQENVTLSERN